MSTSLAHCSGGPRQQPSSASLHQHTPSTGLPSFLYANSIFEGIRGHTDHEHGDGIQFLYTLGGLDGGIFIDGLSIETNYQGLFLPQTPGDTFTEVRVDSMDISFTEPAAADAGVHPWLLWF